MTDDLDLIRHYLETALMHEQAGNEFGHGFWLGRAMSHAEQNAIDPAWLVEEMDSRGLDSTLVPVPKIEAARG